MLRSTLRTLTKIPKAPSATYGFPQSKEAFTELKKNEPLENYASWDTQRYVNKGVCFYDLIHNMAEDRCDRDDANNKKNSFR